MSLKSVDSNTKFDSSIRLILNKPFDVKQQIPLIVDVANQCFATQYSIKDSINWGGGRKLICKELEKSITIRILNINIKYFKIIEKAFEYHANCIQPYFHPNLKLQHEEGLAFEQGEIIIFLGVAFKSWRK